MGSPARQQLKTRVRVMGFGITEQIYMNLFYEPEWSIPKNLRPKCRAKCRNGHTCQAPVVWDKKNNRPVNGRCRMHGGLSTGPRTYEGRIRALMNLKQFRDISADRTVLNY